MAWNTPITFVANAILTAAQLNAQVRDNMLETAPAKATDANRLMVTTGMNAIAEREFVEDFISTEETTTSTSYADLPTVGPSVTVTTGTAALVIVNSKLQNATAGQQSYASFDITGATTTGASDTWAVFFRPSDNGFAVRAGAAHIITVTPGSNTFTMKYRATGGTGNFEYRRLQVLGL